MKLDLHNYGTIGFQPYWLRAQNYNPKTLLEQTVNQCFSKGIDACGITSKEFIIPKGSVHDRFGYLLAQTKNLSRDYEHDKIGDSALVVKKGDKKVFLLNTQGVISRNEEGRRIDFLVIGSDQVENNLLLGDSIKQATDKGLIKIIHYPLLLSSDYLGMPMKEMKKYWRRFDAIAVHDAQTPFPLNLLIRSKIKEAENFAKNNRIPMIAVSGAHRIEDIGTAYIESLGELESLGKDYLLTSLKQLISKGHVVKGSISLYDFYDWNSKFRKGPKHLDKIRDF